jgi:hypothetical protein
MKDRKIYSLLTAAKKNKEKKTVSKGPVLAHKILALGFL